jgi:hypothetical protein
MRRPVQAALAAAVVLLLGATVILYQKYQKTSADYVETKAAEETARSNYISAFNSIAEIQDSLNAIIPQEGRVQLRSQGLEAEQKLTAPSRQQTLESIALLNASIERTKEKISLLESNLKKSGTRIVGLQKMVANLKQNVMEKEGMIAQLSGRVDSLQTQVTGLATEVADKTATIEDNKATIEEKRRENATVFVAVGTKKQLAEQGVIVAKGGVLGIGKTIQPTGVGTEAAYKPMDTDQETVVPIPSTKAKVVSAQPPSSYELVLAGNQTELHILDPKEFRKIKQLVIVTA